MGYFNTLIELLFSFTDIFKSEKRKEQERINHIVFEIERRQKEQKDFDFYFGNLLFIANCGREISDYDIKTIIRILKKGYFSSKLGNGLKINLSNIITTDELIESFPDSQIGKSNIISDWFYLSFPINDTKEVMEYLHDICQRIGLDDNTVCEIKSNVKNTINTEFCKQFNLNGYDVYETIKNMLEERFKFFDWAYDEDGNLKNFKEIEQLVSVLDFPFSLIIKRKIEGLILSYQILTQDNGYTIISNNEIENFVKKRLVFYNNLFKDWGVYKTETVLFIRHILFNNPLGEKENTPTIDLLYSDPTLFKKYLYDPFSHNFYRYGDYSFDITQKYIISIEHVKISKR